MAEYIETVVRQEVPDLAAYLLARYAEDGSMSRSDRTLRERIVAEHPHKFSPGDGRLIGPEWECQSCRHSYPAWWCPTLRLLALPYVDRDDFEPEWRP